MTASRIAMAIEPMGVFALDPESPVAVRQIFVDGQRLTEMEGLVDFGLTFLVSPERWMLDVTNVRQQPGVSGADVQSLLRILVCAMDASIYADHHYSDRCGVRVGAVVVRHRRIESQVAQYFGGWVIVTAKPKWWNLWAPTEEERAAAGPLGRVMRKAFEALDRRQGSGDPLDGAKADHVQLAARVLREAGVIK